MSSGVVIAVVILIALSVLTAASNIAGCIGAYLNHRQGIDKGYSSVPLVSLVLGVCAWLVGRDQLGWWPLLPAVLDPGTWISLCLPWVLWICLVGDKGTARPKRPPDGESGTPGDDLPS